MRFLIMIIFSLLSWHHVSASFWDRLGDFVDDAANGTRNGLNDLNYELRNLERVADETTAEIKKHMQEQQAINPNYDATTDPYIINLNKKINKVEQSADFMQGLATDVKDIYTQTIKGGIDMFFGSMNAKKQKDLARDQALVQGHMANRGQMERLKFLTEQLKDPQNLVKGVAALTAVSLGIAGSYYGTKLGYQYVQARMDKPRLVRESSRASVWLELKRIFGIDLPIEAKLSDVVLSPEIEKQVYALADDTKLVREYGLPYQNMLYYGPPGTGKTEFAKTVAHYADMDYAIMSGADFSQFKDGEDVVELHKLFDWAEVSKRGLLIFIDEADACLRDRAMLSDREVKLVNAFLSRTGSSSDKFMIILATNYEDELDGAVRSRIHKKLKFDLPELEQRFKIMEKKIEKYIINDEREIVKDDGSTVTYRLEFAPTVNEQYLRDVAKRIEGFSGRDIDQFIAEVRLATYRSGSLIITRDIFDYIIAEKIKQIEKDKLTTAYQRARANKKFAMPEDTTVSSASGAPEIPA